MNKMPKRFPAVVADKALICMHTVGEMVIHLEMEFARPLDAYRLERALDLLLDAEPILGCRLPEHVTFDQPASAAWLIIPPEYPPTLLLGLSGYAGSLTLSAASYGPAATPEFLDGLFDNILAQLPV